MDEFVRYSRQILFKPIGKDGQRKLLNSRVVIVGMGALGTVISNHLVRAGIGTIRMIDRDIVELSNLQRQSLYDEEDVTENLPKVIAAEKKLRKINSGITIEAIIADLNLDNAEDLLRGFHVIIDGTDNFSTRYLINDVSVKLGIPWVHGGAVSSRGEFAVFIPEKTPCYRCLFPEIQTGFGDTCDTIGVLSPLTNIIGSFEAMEAMKLLVGASHNPNLEQIDIWNSDILQMDISNGHNPDCPTCVHHQYDFLNRSSYQQIAYAVLCGRDTVQINPRNTKSVILTDLAEKFKDSGKVVVNSFLLKFSPNENVTMVFFKDGRVLVHGVEDITQAKAYYSKYVG